MIEEINFMWECNQFFAGCVMCDVTSDGSDCCDGIVEDTEWVALWLVFTSKNDWFEMVFQLGGHFLLRFHHLVESIYCGCSDNLYILLREFVWGGIGQVASCNLSSCCNWWKVVGIDVGAEDVDVFWSLMK